MFVVQSGCLSLEGRCSGTSHTQPGGMWCLLLPGTGENGTGLHVDREEIRHDYKSICVYIIAVHNCNGLKI